MARLIKSCITLLLVLSFHMLSAQPGNPGGDPDAIPIDGGIGILIAAGAVLGVKKIYDLNKTHKGSDKI